MDKLAAMYARVSTLQQEQEATIDSQVAAVEAYAQSQGYRLSKEFYFLDQAVSGGQLARPGLDRLRDLAAEGLFQVLVCLSPDRLARQYAHQWLLLDELQRAGVQVVFVNQPRVEDNPQGQLLLGVQGLFAEYERAVITERLRRGKLYRIRQGQLVNPVPPYGYRYIPVSEVNGGRWEEQSPEGSIVRQIFSWYTEREGATICSIVDRLNQLGPAAPPRGRRWTYSTVQAILKQPAYTGQAYYNRTHVCAEAVGRPKKHGRGVKRTPVHALRPKDEWIPVSVPVLVAPDLWNTAQERLAMQRKFSPRNNQQHFYLLRSLLVCGVCGRTLVGRTVGDHVTYSCSSRGKNRSPEVAPHTCAIAAEVVEPRVWEAVTRLLHHPRLLADAWESQSSTADSSPGEVDRLQARSRVLDRQWQRLIDLFQEEQIDKAEFARRKERLDQEHAVIGQRLEQLRHQERHELAKEQMLQDFTAFCQRIESNLANPTPELRQEVIRLLIDHVLVKQDEIVIRHIVPTDDDCRLLPGHR